MKLKFFIIPIFLGLLAPFGLAQRPTSLKKQIKKLIKYETSIDLEEHEGLFVIIYDHDSIQTVQLGSFEEAARDSLLYCNQFHLGGITKTFVAAQFQALFDLNKIQPDDLIGSLLFPDSIPVCLASVSYADLIHHRSGLPKLPDNLGVGQDPTDPYKHYDYNSFVDFLYSYRRPEKVQSIYSHLNYVLLGLAYEALEGTSIVEKFQGWKIQQEFRSCNSELMSGFDRAGSVVQPWKTGVFESSLGLQATPSEMLFWLKQNIQATSGELQRPKTSSRISKDIYVSNGWYYLDYYRYPIFLHSGRASGHYAFSGYISKTQKGVLLFSNTQKGMEDLGILILAMIDRKRKRRK